MDEMASFFEHTNIRGRRRRGRAAIRSSRIPCENLESARCRLRRYSSQHQQRWGVARRAAITVLVSPSNRMDVHERHPAGHPVPEGTISAGYDWRKGTVCKKVSCTERSCCASCEILQPRWNACISSFDCILVARTDICYCNLTCMQGLWSPPPWSWRQPPPPSSPPLSPFPLPLPSPLRPFPPFPLEVGHHS